MLKCIRNIVLLSTVLCLIGCAPKVQKPEDPCAFVYPCWGKQGQNPSDNIVCQKLITCSNWKMEAR